MANPPYLPRIQREHAIVLLILVKNQFRQSKCISVGNNELLFWILRGRVSAYAANEGFSFTSNFSLRSGHVESSSPPSRPLIPVGIRFRYCADIEHRVRPSSVPTARRPQHTEHHTSGRQ